MSNYNLSNAFPVVAAQLGGSLGINVYLGNSNTAYTDGKDIYLPSIDFQDESAANFGFGYTCHEASHIRYTTLWTKSGNKFKDHMVNVLEDIRIERKLPTEFPGTRDRLYNLNKLLMGDQPLNPNSLNKDSHPATVISNYCLIRGLLGNGNDFLEDECNSLENIVKEVFKATTPIKLNALISEVHQCEDTQAVSVLTDKIIKMLDEESQDDSDDDSQDGSGDDSQDGSGNDSQSNSGDGSGDDSNSSDNTEEGSGDSMSDITTQMLSATDDDLPDDKMDGVEEVLSKSAKDNPDSENAYNASDASEANNSHSVNDPIKSANIYNEALTLSSGLKVQLRALVQAIKAKQPYAARTGNRIDSSLMHRVAINDGRVFSKRSESTQINTAVHVLLDKSSSMQYSGFMHDAMVSAASLSIAMSGIQGINSAFSVFPHGDSTDVYSISKHNEVSTSDMPLGVPASGCTPMTQAMWYAGIELMKQKEQRKILIVVTDGQPDDEPTVKKFIDLAQNSNVEVIGIGIRAEYVKDLFPVSIVIDEPSDLRTELYDIMKSRLNTNVA